jgi:3-hydroxybutyryl-CoA dehydrogenase
MDFKSLGNVDFAIEAATESPSLKLDIFKALDKATPSNAILATNTSSISITKIASATKRPEQVVPLDSGDWNAFYEPRPRNEAR